MQESQGFESSSKLGSQRKSSLIMIRRTVLLDIVSEILFNTGANHAQILSRMAKEGWRYDPGDHLHVHGSVDEESP